MCEKKKEIPSFFSLVLARCPKTLCWLLPENQATKTKRNEPGNSKKIKKTFCSDCEKFFLSGLFYRATFRYAINDSKKK
jgi:hypothetical protein